jgi:hypothetical protein
VAAGKPTLPIGTIVAEHEIATGRGAFKERAQMGNWQDIRPGRIYYYYYYYYY